MRSCFDVAVHHQIKQNQMKEIIFDISLNRLKIFFRSHHQELV